MCRSSVCLRTSGCPKTSGCPRTSGCAGLEGVSGLVGVQALTLYDCAKLLQSFLTLCDPTDCSLLVSSVHGILEARILEWIAMVSSRVSSQSRDQSPISHVS